MQRIKQATKNLAKVASIERLRNRIIASNNIFPDEEYMNVHISDGNSISDKSPLRINISDNISEINEAQDINISQAAILEKAENGREQRIYNEQDVIEALDLSDDEDDEIILQDETDQEIDASEDSDDYDENINKNHFDTEEQKANYVAEKREWAIYDGYISKKKLDNLLFRLNPVFPTLSKSYKTLLRTPKHFDVCVLPDGSMLWYKRIVRNLD